MVDETWFLGEPAGVWFAVFACLFVKNIELILLLSFNFLLDGFEYGLEGLEAA